MPYDAYGRFIPTQRRPYPGRFASRYAPRPRAPYAPRPHQGYRRPYYGPRQRFAQPYEPDYRQPYAPDPYRQPPVPEYGPPVEDPRQPYAAPADEYGYYEDGREHQPYSGWRRQPAYRRQGQGYYGGQRFHRPPPRGYYYPKAATVTDRQRVAVPVNAQARYSSAQHVGDRVVSIEQEFAQPLRQWTVPELQTVRKAIATYTTLLATEQRKTAAQLQTAQTQQDSQNMQASLNELAHLNTRLSNLDVQARIRLGEPADVVTVDQQQGVVPEQPAPAPAPAPAGDAFDQYMQQPAGPAPADPNQPAAAMPMGDDPLMGMGDDPAYAMGGEHEMPMGDMHDRPSMAPGEHMPPPMAGGHEPEAAIVPANADPLAAAPQAARQPFRGGDFMAELQRDLLGDPAYQAAGQPQGVQIHQGQTIPNPVPGQRQLNQFGIEVPVNAANQPMPQQGIVPLPNGQQAQARPVVQVAQAPQQVVPQQQAVAPQQVVPQQAAPQQVAQPQVHQAQVPQQQSVAQQAAQPQQGGAYLPPNVANLRQRTANSAGFGAQQGNLLTDIMNSIVLDD